MSESSKSIHGIFMLFGMGWLMPLGIISAKLLKNRPNYLMIHQVCQTACVALAFIGFLVALRSFDAFSKPKSSTAYIHGCLGVVVMVISFTQPIHGYLRPTLTTVTVRRPNGQAAPSSKSKRRIIWEYGHKAGGYLSFLLSIPTITLGLRMTGLGFQLLYYLGIWGSLIIVLGILGWDRYSHKFVPTANDENENASVVSEDFELGDIPASITIEVDPNPTIITLPPTLLSSSSII